MTDDTATDPKVTLRSFHSVVNMTASQLEKWLRTEESKAVGQKKDSGGKKDSDESVGHASGRRIVALLQKNQSEFTDGDYEHMTTVVGFVHRHLKQRPSGDVTDTPWRFSLMNWGHDPLKK
ncbi:MULTISPECIES: DUF3140 domain-containing protein [Subtercola]|uniref:DUF3140 domain-containing protein n=1 Tax=Subtercola vilae TaxID=2056433 RepID=A0A4T2CDU3_9MICO|nr:MULTISPECIES: DUF3140 domain-containing protein [Subtercola]MEA9983706.1 DUF3140 domain-containing protein [Subtercola sp. RTI3]TIH40746.1 DUF3140 domain-containing protein [Subtercola vilae]